MGKASRQIQLKHARRLAVSSQLLDRIPGQPTKENLLATIRQLGCVQYDPIRVVAPSHYLVLWSRLGSYPTEMLDELLWRDRTLFEYWAHAASIVLAENFPIHRHQMDSFATGESTWARRARKWLVEHEQTRKDILEELRRNQPMKVSDFELEAEALWESSGWSNAQGVKHLLQLMWLNGEVAVAGRDDIRKVWGTADRLYQPYAQFGSLSLEQAVEKAVLIATRALGVATAQHIENHFTKGSYPGLKQAIARLVERGLLLPATVEGAGKREAEWYLAADQLEALERIERGEWQGRTTLLTPFDNLTTDRDRVDRLWGFNARSELYVPKKDRKFGHYVLPLLWRDRLVGRVDPTYHRDTQVLEVEAIFPEDWSRPIGEIGQALGGCLLDLAGFLGAQDIKLSRRIPRAWHQPLKKTLAA